MGAAQLARKEHRLADAHRDLVEAVRLCRQSGERRQLVRAFQAMTAARRFAGSALDELAKAKILGVRAGTEHRYTGVWVVVVEGRVFVRSWNDKPTGWYRAFQAQPLGSIRLAGREIAIRARRLRGERLRDAVTRAYAGKYDTKASEKWVRGFAEPHRSAATLELLPVQPSPAPDVSS
jgi:hypothetical protein